VVSETIKIPELDAKSLRNFGLSTGAIIAGIFGLLLPWVFDHGFPRWPWILFSVLAAWALIAPKSLQPIYQAWMRLGLLISKVTTPIVLGVIFFAVVTPFGLIRRMFGGDPMARESDEQASTYRLPSEHRPKENLENPY
jgi:hypothetical protein